MDDLNNEARRSEGASNQPDLSSQSQKPTVPTPSSQAPVQTAPVAPAETPEKPAELGSEKEEKPMVSEKKQKNLKLFFSAFAVVIGVLLVAAVAFGLIRVYVNAATDSTTYVVAKVLRLPLAKVDGQIIYYTDYIDDLKAIHVLQSFEKENGGGTTGSLDEAQLSDQVVLRLANNIFVGELAKKYGVIVKEDEVEDLTGQILTQFESQEQAESELLKRYGWTLDVYKNKVMRPYLLQMKLDDLFSTDISLRDAVREQAEKVLAEIQNGANFEEMAKKYGEDLSARNGGDLGWFSQGDMVSEFEDAVSGLEEGETTDELVETVYGYHIIKLLEKSVDESKDADGKTIKTDKYHAEHIVFLFPTLNNLLGKATDLSSVNWYVKKINNPLNPEDLTVVTEQISE